MQSKEDGEGEGEGKEEGEPASMVKVSGCVLQFTGVGKGKSREDIREDLLPFGTVAYVDFDRGKTEVCSGHSCHMNCTYTELMLVSRASHFYPHVKVEKGEGPRKRGRGRGSPQPLPLCTWQLANNTIHTLGYIQIFLSFNNNYNGIKAHTVSLIEL